MTAVIGRMAAAFILPCMAAPDDIQRVAAALERPEADYLARVDETRRLLSARSVEAARQLDVFLSRVGDLTLEELRELYEETFCKQHATVRPVIQPLAEAETGRVEAAAALGALAPVLDRLEADRNPYVYVVRSLCCLLLYRLSASPAHVPPRELIL